MTKPPKHKGEDFYILPEAQAELDKITSSDPEGADAIRSMMAAMRQAHHACKAGQYKTFSDAMEAITGQRPQPVGPKNMNVVSGNYVSGLTVKEVQEISINHPHLAMNMLEALIEVLQDQGGSPDDIPYVIANLIAIVCHRGAHQVDQLAAKAKELIAATPPDEEDEEPFLQ